MIVTWPTPMGWASGAIARGRWPASSKGILGWVNGAFVKLIERLLLQVTVVQESYQNLRPAPTRGRGVRHSGFSAAHGMDIYKEYLSAK